MSSPHVAELSSAVNSAELEAAFEAADDAGADAVVLVLDARCRPDSTFAEDVVRSAIARPSIRVLTLVHPSASVGFLASSLQLRLGDVHVRARRSLEHDSRPPAETPIERRARRLAERERRESSAQLQLGLATLPIDASASDVQAAFGRVRGCAQCVLVFEGRGRAVGSLVEWISTGVRSSESIQELTLVHDSPAIGFLASSLALHLPNVRVAAKRALPELEGLL